VVSRLECSGLDCRSWPRFSALGRRRIPPHGRPSSIKETTNPPKWQNRNSNPLQVILSPAPCPLSPIPHPPSPVPCSLPVSLFYECPQSPHPEGLFSRLFHIMSNASFRLESFRPWNPFQDKAQSLRDSLDICRYPSPVSMTATAPLSNPIDPVSKSQKSHSYKPG
jgi:hypothetical protein